MSIEDDIKQGIADIRTELDDHLYGSSGTSIDVNDDISGSTSSGTISLDPNTTANNDLWSIDSSDVVFSDSTSTWGTITIQAGPWALSGKPNGDLELVFETKDERKEYHIHHEKIIALLEKFADVKVEGKKEDV
jgi:hypothetical protein